MRRFLTLVHKEWRDTRALSLVCALLVPLALLAAELGFLDWRGDFAGAYFVPGVIALYLAVIASDLVAADAATGRARSYAMLPVRPATLWSAKLAFLLVAGAAFTVWTLAVTTGLYAAFAPQDAIDLLGRELDHMRTTPLLAIAAVVAATVMWSTVLERGFAAVGAALVTCAALVGACMVVGSRNAELLPEEGVMRGAAYILPALFLAISCLTFVRGPVHASGTLRRLVLTAACLLAVFVPTGAVWAAVALERLHVEPGDPELRVQMHVVSSDGRFATLIAQKRHRDASYHVWTLNLETGQVVALPGRRWNFDWFDASWGDDGLVRLWTQDAGPIDDALRHEIDPATGRILRTRSYAQLRESHETPRRRWLQRQFGEDVDVNGVVHVWPVTEQGTRRSADARVIHHGRPNATWAYVSPGSGRYVSVMDSGSQTIYECATGMRIDTVGASRPRSVLHWPGGGSDDRFAIRYGEEPAMALVDLETGRETPVPGGRADLRILDDHRVLTHTESGEITLLDLTAGTSRVLYAPRRD